MKKYYYFKTVVEDKKKDLRVVALPGQTLGDGKTEVKVDIKVSCSKTVRSAYEKGTIFVGDELKFSEGKKCYGTKNFRRLSGTMKKETDYYKSVFKKEFVDPIKKETLREQIQRNAKLGCPTSKKDGFYVSQEDWYLLVRNALTKVGKGTRVNTLIVGETGVGKTTIVSQLCARLGLSLFTVDCSTLFDQSSLLGTHRLEKGKSIFDFAPFVSAIQKPGVILLDEINRASLQLCNLFLPILDDRKVLRIEIAGKLGAREIKVHPDCIFIGTANIGNQSYSGTNQIDRALLSRFQILELKNIPETEECDVLCTRTGIEPDKAKMIVKVLNNLRSLYSKQELSGSPSIRESLMIAELCRDGWSIGTALSLILLPLYEGTVSEGERSIVYKTISSY